MQWAIFTHTPPSQLCARLLSRVQWLDWRFVMSLSFSIPSRAVIPLDPQRIPHLHPAGQKALCLPDNGQPLHLQGGLFGQWQLLLHRFQSIYFQECFLQLHPACPSEWTLVPDFQFSFCPVSCVSICRDDVFSHVCMKSICRKSMCCSGYDEVFAASPPTAKKTSKSKYPSVIVNMQWPDGITWNKVPENLTQQKNSCEAFSVHKNRPWGGFQYVLE